MFSHQTVISTRRHPAQPVPVLILQSYTRGVITKPRRRDIVLRRYIHAGVPGGLVGGPRGFKSHRVHARRGFSCIKKLIGGKRESVS